MALVVVLSYVPLQLVAVVAAAAADIEKGHRGQKSQVPNTAVRGRHSSLALVVALPVVFLDRQLANSRTFVDPLAGLLAHPRLVRRQKGTKIPWPVLLV